MTIAADLALALDPVRLAQRAGLDPDDWQARVLRSNAPRLLLNCSRQSGKSTVSGVLAAHTALYQPGALVLLLSPALRQSQELFRKVLSVYEAAGRLVPAEAESALRLELENGSRIIALPGKEHTIRSYSGVRLLLIDEASRVDDALYYSTRPMLAVSGGRLVLLSTPFGARGVFHHEWTQGQGWERTEVAAYDCPRIPADFLEKERQSMGPWWFEQEYLCRFMDAQDAVFREQDITGGADPSIEPLFEGVAR